MPLIYSPPPLKAFRLDKITLLILTYKRARQHRRSAGCGFSWARRIVVIDSGSTDGTLEDS